MKKPFVPVLLAFLFVCGLTTGKSSADELEKGLQRDLLESKLAVDQAGAKLRSGGAPVEETARLKNVAEKVRASQLLMGERFTVRGQQAAALGEKAAERQDAVAVGFRKALEEYLALIDALPPDGVVSPATLDALTTLLNKIIPPKKRPLHGTLPYKHLSYPAREPATFPTVVPAYKGGDRTVNPADTAASAEAPISAEITALAQSLQWNPVLIYEWVKNNVETEWYWGVMKGAEETLQQKSGNDCDQSALLVSLLRASGFPARFVKGTIEFFPGIDKVKNLTGIDDPLKIAAFFQKAGIPFKPVIVGGTITNFHIEHIWVESEIPYSNYRGAVIDDFGKSWLGLDTSIKPPGLARNAPLDLPNSSFDTLRDEYLQTVQTVTPLEFLKAKAEEYLSQNNPGKGYQDLLSTRTIIPDILKIIPSSLQFRQVAITGEYAELPADLRHQVRFTATGPASSELFTITLDALRLSNQRVTLSYEPETVEDQQIIDSYGGLDNTPSYLVRLRPVLLVNGERMVVAQDGLPMGTDYTLNIDIIAPNGTETVTSTQITGNLSVIGIVGQKAAAVTPIADSDDAEGILFKEALGYIDRWNKAEDELAAFYRVAVTRPVPSLVTVGSQIDVTWLLGIPHGFEWKGVFIDAGYRRIETVGRSSEAETGFMRLSALQGSILENRIFEDDFQVDSVSTAKLLQLAKTNNTPLVTIDKTNIDTLLPQLPFDAAVKEDVTNAVNQGLTVTIPQVEVAYQDWTGIGYLKENPTTGESGWMLSGQVAGGMTVWIPERWNTAADKNRSAVLRAPYTGPPNTHPLKPYSIIKIPVTDLQFGTVGKQLKPWLQVKVVDAASRPVNKTTVTFKVLAGGGKLGNGASEQTVTTDNRGLAKVSLTLGEQTSANPIYWQVEGNAIADQYGGNVVDAKLDSGASVLPPFTAFGMPGPPDHLRKTHGDGKTGMIHSFAGFVGLLMEDSYGNPIANQPVKFTIADPIGAPACNKDNTPGILVKDYDPCINSSPTTADLSACTTAAASFTVTSNVIVTAAEVILGGAPSASYKVTATTTATNSTGGALAPVEFTLNTLPFGDCNIDGPSTATLVTTFVQPTDAAGRNIDAGRSGTTITLRAKEYLLKEGERQVDENLSCSGATFTCPKNVGSHTYSATTTFEASSIMFNGAPGIDKRNGVFELPYILSPGLNTIRIDGQVVYKKHENANSCAICQITDKLETLTATAWLKVYGVDIKVKPSLKIMLDSANRSRNSLRIPYTIAPANYQAFSANILLYKVTNIADKVVEEQIDYIPTETKGSGFGILARGYLFDPAAEYKVQVVLNYGTGVQAASDKVPITFALGALVPDYNHNRAIEDDDDLDRALNDDTYYFWVNDDDGNGDTGGTGIPNTRDPATIGAVNGTRDLIDYFPVHLDVKKLTETYAPGAYTYRLKNADGALSLVLPGLAAAESGKYLTDITTAQILADAPSLRITANGLTLDATQLQVVKGGKDVLLLEGWKATKKPLVLEIADQSGSVVFTSSLNLSIAGVEQMFRHKNLIQATGGPPPGNGDGGALDRLTQPDNFPDSEANGKNFVFLHGHRVKGNEARGWHSEIFKRMYWSGSKAKFWGVSWNVNSIDYYGSVINAFNTASHLQQFLNWSVNGEITIAAHSLGNMVVSSVLSDYNSTVSIKNYYLINAAVASEAYDGATPQTIDMVHPDWDNYKEELWASEWYKLFMNSQPTDYRSTLTWRNRFGIRPANTTYYNFYSSGEDVLERHPHDNVPSLDDVYAMVTQGGHWSWAIQEKFKGMFRVPFLTGSYYGGWSFNLNDYAEPNSYPSPQRLNFLIANQLDPQQLRTKPFFAKGPDDAALFSEFAGSAYALKPEVRNRLLAEALPARTLAAGRQRVSAFPYVNNTEMQRSDYQNGWPAERIASDDQRWRHNDFKKIAYPFVFKLYEEFVKKGGLR